MGDFYQKMLSIFFALKIFFFTCCNCQKMRERFLVPSCCLWTVLKITLQNLENFLMCDMDSLMFLI
jgi:hypothetical protein